MIEKIIVNQLPELFESVAEEFHSHEEQLCDMDSRMGDGDLGLTMKKGFGAMPQVLREMDEPDLSKKLRKAGMEMTDIIPSTMGMLMGTGVSYAGKALKDHTEMGAEELVLFLQGYAKGIMARGKCSRGERTVLDAIGTAADHAEEALKNNPGASLAEICNAALMGAEEGVEATKNMLPKYGKAAVHANMAVGIADQGATAGMLFVKGLYDYICNA